MAVVVEERVWRPFVLAQDVKAWLRNRCAGGGAWFDDDLSTLDIFTLGATKSAYILSKDEGGRHTRSSTATAHSSTSVPLA